ncbi:MAG: PKD domain-containing protein [Phycisphaerae bacterium]|nr:PKD domain-containing protein [Saprospiraceae bacterium]
MNQTLTNFAASHKSGFFLLLLCSLFSFQKINAQHCHPSFHFTVNGNTVIFQDQSTADGNITSYNWDFGDGNTSTEQNPTHTYAAPGTYNVCLTITAHHPDCTETFCHHVVINHPPPGECHAAFAAHQADPAQPTIDFTDQSTSDGNIVSWEWDFGDGNTSTEQNPSHTYAGPGAYHVCLTITDDEGCSSHVCHDVVIHHAPHGVCHAEFISHQPDPAQPTIDFTDQSTSDGIIGTWEWDFGDGNTSNEQNPSHTYSAPGVYLVCLTITDEDGHCTSHVCHHLVIHHAPLHECQAAFAVHQPDPALPTFDFTDQSTSDGTIVSWQWDFGDGNTSNDQNPTHTYSAVGAYLVCLTIVDDGGCTSHVCHQIVVHHTPPGHCHAAFHASQPNPDHPIIQFTDLSTSDGGIDAWEWDFGDGNTSTEQNPTHTYAAPGTYLVCLTIYDDDGGCTSHVCHHIQVNHPPAGDCHAAFTFELDASGLGVQFTNTSTGTTAHTTYFWDFGDGGTSTEENPHHTYSHDGHYTVCLFIEDLTIGCHSHICHTITLPHHGLRPGIAQVSKKSTLPPSNKLMVYPNPVLGSLQIDYQIPVAGKVVFELYNLTGVKIIEFAEDMPSAGSYTKVISVGNLVSGVYVLQTTINGVSYLCKITVQ